MLLLLLSSTAAHAQIDPSMLAGHSVTAAVPAQTIASLSTSPSPCSYPSGSPAGTAVCTVSATMNPPSPQFGGGFSGTNTQFAVASSGAITLAETDPGAGNYSLPVTATSSNHAIAPYTQTIPISSVSGSGCASDSTILPPAPNGMCWSRTFDEEFTVAYGTNPNSPGLVNLNPAIWSQGGTNTTAAQSIAHIPPGNNMTENANNAQNETQSPDAQPQYPSIPGFYQKYGFFVVNALMPVAKAGDELDLELFAQGTYGFQYGYPVGYGEWAFYIGGPFSHPTSGWCSIWDQPSGTQHVLTYSFGNGSDLSSAYHQYGFLWTNDGSTYGTAQCLFDGSVQGSSYTITGSWSLGAYFDEYGGGDTQADPLTFQWIRAYQLISGKKAP